MIVPWVAPTLLSMSATRSAYIQGNVCATPAYSQGAAGSMADCFERNGHSERNEESRPDFCFAIRPRQSQIPGFARNDTAWSQHSVGAIAFCGEVARSALLVLPCHTTI